LFAVVPASAGKTFASLYQHETMAELKAIAETLRRQRQELEDDLESTSVRQGENSRLLEDIEKLRRRVEDSRDKPR
jgi:polyhydroxyalkanoate synthesis regulator phasin